MDSKRQQKFARLIQKDLGEIFQQEARNLFGGAFITVTAVRITPDLSQARVYLSFMLAKDKAGLLAEVSDQTKLLRQKLADRIRHQARIIPELQFYLDDTAEYAAKIDNLFAGLVIPPAAEAKDEEE